MALINSYIDFGDYSGALKHNIYDGSFWDLVPGFLKKTDIYVQKNYGDFQDGVFVYDDQSSNKFAQIINTQDRFLQESSDTNEIKINAEY